MNKRVNYMELLKESVADRGHDTTKSVDVKGPFLDPILGYDGGGELPTYKDASSILERYYFNQDADKGVAVAEDAAIPQVGDDKGALKDVPEDVDKSKADAKKATELKEEEEKDGKALPEEETEEDDAIAESKLLEDDVENAVIERLIAEMEEDVDLLEEEDMTDDDDKDKDDDKEEIKENSSPQDPAAKNHEPSGDPDKDSSGLVDGDDHKGGEDVVKPATFPAGSDGVGKGIKAAMKEGEDIVSGDKELPKDEVPTKDEELDVDEKSGIKTEGGSPIGNPATADEDKLYENLDEQFEIFKEAIEEEEKEEKEDDDDKDKKPTFEKGKVPDFGKKDVKV